MFQDIFPHTFENSFNVIKEIREDDFIFYFEENKLLLKKSSDSYTIPRKKDFNSFTEISEAIFLFTFNKNNCFLISKCPNYDSDTFEFQENSNIRYVAPNEIAWACSVAHQLQGWYETNRFCGKCGSQTILKPDERAIQCPNCNSLVFPKISPAIIVAVLCKNKILLARGVNFRSNWYSLVAGYADVGESLEDTVVREVKEEVGIDVTNIRYYKSQPWPYSSTMMIGFIADADASQPIVLDKKEIEDAGWFTKDTLPNYPPTFSIAGEIIGRFINGEL